MNSMLNILFKVSRREVGNILSSKWQLSIVSWLPLAGMYMIYAIFSHGIPRDLPVAVIDNDHSQLSRDFSRQISANPSLLVTHQLQDMAQAKAELQQTNIFAAVYIPHDFQKDIYLGKKPQVSTFYNAQYVLIGKVIASNMAKTFATFTAKIDAGKTLSKGSHIQNVKGMVAPISTQVSPLYNVSTNYVPFLATSAVPSLWQAFIVIAMILSVGVEYKRRTAKSWLEASEQSMTLAVFGKMLPYTVIFTLQGLLFSVFFYSHLSMPMHGEWSHLLLSIFLAVLAGQAVAVLLFSITMNLTQAISMGAAYTAPAFAFIGITFPSDSMPLFAQIWRQLLPITHYMQLQIGIVNYGQDFSELTPELGIFCLFVCTLGLAIYRMSVMNKTLLVHGEAV